MESREKRKVRSGREYDSLFPRPNGKNVLIKKEASVRDTVEFIQEAVPKTTADTAKIAPLLKGKTLEETCRNIWLFVYQHIPYKRDRAGIEEVRRPARAWHDRNHPDEEGKVGVDCDCYTVFISSILHNLGIPHILRITKYWKQDPDEIRWQHIYPIVPIKGISGTNNYRQDYIVLDCVKEAYNDEEPYFEKKDFGMRLEYLDGVDDEEEYIVPNNRDMRELADLYGEEEMGKIGSWVKKTVKKVGKAVGKGFKFLNRFTNPGAILLRNGFLAAMKLNMMHIAAKLRYGYLSPQQAVARGMNLNAFNKLKKVLEKAEKIYEGAGGKKSNLKKAILSGKGNKNGRINLSGFEGDDMTYADREEYNVLFGLEGFGDLGEPVTAASIAAATASLTALAGALSQVKNLFKKGSSEGKEFEGGATGGGGAGNATLSSDAAADPEPSTATNDGAAEDTTTAEAENLMPVSQKKTIAPPAKVNNNLPTTQESNSETEIATTTSKEKTTSEQPVKFTQSPIKWVKQNPGKSLLFAGLLVGAGYLASKALKKKNNSSKSNNQSMEGLDGLPARRRKKSRGGKKKNSKSKESLYLKAITIKD